MELDIGERDPGLKSWVSRYRKHGDLAVDRVETLDARTYKRANNEKRG